MSACCVPGCKKRYVATNKVKFYRIPTGNRPFQANRRRLWLRAIQGAIGSTEEIKSGARICGAHFVSGEASLDHDNPDFVPSVFASNKSKRRVRRHRRRRPHRTTGKTAPPEDESSVDLQSFAYLESESELPDATEISDPSLPKEGKPVTKANEAASSTKKPSLSADKLETPSPVVLLKSVVAPAGGFQCELCTQNLISVSELLKHKEGHNEDKQTYMCEMCGKHIIGRSVFAEHQRAHLEYFSCNVCHRSFTTSHQLKRHKLLHVKDSRKCPLCSVLFCRRHNHIPFLPKPESASESEQDCSSIEPQNLNIDLMSENSRVEKCIAPEAPALKSVFSSIEPQNLNIDIMSENTQVEVCIAPEAPALKSVFFSIKPQNLNSDLMSDNTQVEKCTAPAPRIPTLKSIFSLPWPPLPVLKIPRISSRRKASLSCQPAAFIEPTSPKRSELPASLQVFSPQYLTSASLEVKRDYEYILSVPKEAEKEVVKDKDVEHSVKQVRKQRIAYDMEIVL